MMQKILTLQIGMRWAGLEGSGGLDRVFYQLVKGLPALGIETVGLVQGPDNVATLTSGQVEAFARDGAMLVSRLIGVRRSVRNILAKREVDLIASHFSLYVAPALDLLKGHKHVVHFHGPWGDESFEEMGGHLSSNIKRAIERLIYFRADKIVVLSQAFSNLIVQRYGIDENQIVVIPGGVDLVRFENTSDKAASRRKLGLPQDRPIILSVRRLALRMGLGDLLAAISTVAKLVPEVLLLIAGSGPLRADLEAGIRELRLENNVTLLGFVPDIDLPDLYCASDLHVVPTQSLEGFGLVVVEALAAGTPSIVTRVGGLPEIVEGLAPELVVSPGNPDQLAALISSILVGEIASSISGSL